jgi:signal peptidase II
MGRAAAGRNKRPVEMKRYRFMGCIAALLLLADQLSKHLAERVLPLGHMRVVVEGFFNLVQARNSGAAFGFLSNSEAAWRFWFFAAATALAVAGLLYMARTVPERNYPVLACLGLILGGALGNFIDRCRLGYVRDFLDFYWKEWHWPAFNVADMGISCGVFVFMAFVLTRRTGSKNR